MTALVSNEDGFWHLSQTQSFRYAENHIGYVIMMTNRVDMLFNIFYLTVI